MNNLFTPTDQILDDANVLLNVDFIQHAMSLFDIAYKSYKEKRECLKYGQDAKETNDAIQYVLQVNVFITKIGRCLQGLDDSIIYMRDFYNRKEYDRYNISYTDYIEYHTDMFNYKLSTLKDLTHKLILHIYCEDNKIYKWDVVATCLKKNSNQDLLDLYDEAFPLFNSIMARRHTTAHDGKSDIKELYDLSFIESARLYCTKKPDLDHDDIERASVNLRLTKGHDHIANLVKVRNNILRFLCRYYHYLDNPFHKMAL